MASCHCRLTSLRSVEVSTTSCASYGRLSGHCLKMRVKHWSRRSSPVACNYVFSVEPVAVGSECYRLSGYWYSALYRHDAVAVSATLATGTPSRRLQAWDARSSVAVWHFTIVVIVPSQRPPSFCRCPQTTTVRSTTCRTCIVSCDVDTFDDRGFAAAGPGLWNCLPSHAKKADFVQ